MAEKHGAHLIVDEAHATGCFGPRGSGLVDAAGLRPRVLATVHTGGKALGVPGAYVVGSGRLRELLINRCRQFLYTTALPPRAAAWWIEALDRVQNDDHGRARLRDNVAFFRRLLRDRQIFSLGQDYIVPIGLGDDSRAVAVAARLQAAGFDVRAIRPPTVPLGAARIRISIHADHSAAVLESLAAALADALRGMP
jgi:8-amino-7-oxononanoate synthase